MVEDKPIFPVYAKTEAEATHKFPTAVHWGDGYFGGMRCIVAASDIAAYSVMRHRISSLDWENLWRRDKNGAWINCADLKGTENG
jgi:hypothetical protein